MAQMTQSRVGNRVLRKVVTELKTVADEAFEWNVEQWAGKAKLHPNTVRRLMSGQTRFPRFETVVRLAHVLRLNLLTQDRDTVVLRVRGAEEFDHTITAGRGGRHAETA